MKYTANNFNHELNNSGVVGEDINVAQKGIPWEKYKEDMWPESFKEFKAMIENFKRLYKTHKNPYALVKQLVADFPRRPNELTELFGHMAFDVGPKEIFNTLAGIILNVFYFKEAIIEEVISERELANVLKIIHKAIQ